MGNTNNGSEKLLIGFGIITILCGIGLIFSNQYVMGISGSIVGIGLIFQNIKQIKIKNGK